MTFSVDLRGAPGSNDFFNLQYRSSGGTFSLLGVEAFVVSVTHLTGSGDLVAFVNEGPGMSVRLPITATGDMVYPLTNIITGMPMDSLTQLQFRLYANSADFSVTLDQITMVPEPGAAGLATLAGGCLLLLRRRR